MARTARQILARHCPSPHPFTLTEDEDENPEYWVPYEDAIKAVQDASGEEIEVSDLSPLKGFGLLLITVAISPIIIAIVGTGAVIDRCDNILRRIKIGD
jgi:hypothetical protein